MNKPENNKAYYQSLNILGYSWQGWWDNYHHFVRQEGNGYVEIRCTDQDIEDGNLEEMIALGVTK